MIASSLSFIKCKGLKKIRPSHNDKYGVSGGKVDSDNNIIEKSKRVPNLSKSENPDRKNSITSEKSKDENRLIDKKIKKSTRQNQKEKNSRILESIHNRDVTESGKATPMISPKLNGDSHREHNATGCTKTNQQQCEDFYNQESYHFDRTTDLLAEIINFKGAVAIGSKGNDRDWQNILTNEGVFCYKIRERKSVLNDIVSEDKKSANLNSEINSFLRSILPLSWSLKSDEEIYSTGVHLVNEHSSTESIYELAGHNSNKSKLCF